MGFIFSHFFSPRRILLPSLFFSVPPIVFIYLSIIPDSFNRDPRVVCLSFPSLELIIHLLGIQMLFKSSIDIYLHMYMQDKLTSRGNQVPKCTCKCRYENQAGKNKRQQHGSSIYSTFDSTDWMANVPKVELELWERSRSTFSAICKLRVEIPKKWTFGSRLQSWPLA